MAAAKQEANDLEESRISIKWWFKELESWIMSEEKFFSNERNTERFNDDLLGNQD